MPISYHGRQYAEGKKIGWKDAVSAVWTILKYRVIADVGREDAGYTTLRRVEVLKRYNRFLWDLVAPFVGGRVLEIGSGTGLMTKFLAGKTRVTATDIDQDYVQLLSRTFAGNPNVDVRHLDGSTPTATTFRSMRTTRSSARTCWAHRGRRSALTSMCEVLQPGGRVVLIIPAVKGIYGEIDRAIHHYRRYSRNEIEEKLRAAGLQVEHLSYFNMLGIPGWWLNAVVLRRRSVPGFQARVNDWLVPWLRFERASGRRSACRCSRSAAPERGRRQRRTSQWSIHSSPRDARSFLRMALVDDDEAESVGRADDGGAGRPRRGLAHEIGMGWFERLFTMSTVACTMRAGVRDSGRAARRRAGRELSGCRSVGGRFGRSGGSRRTRRRQRWRGSGLTPPPAGRRRRR